MAKHDSIVADDQRALQTLDVYFSMQLGCSVGDLHRPGWTIVRNRAESDPAALLFEQRPLLSVIAPILRRPDDPTPADRPGVVSVASELRPALAALLRDLPPAHLFTERGLVALDTLLIDYAPDRLTSTNEAYLHVSYVSREGFRPYVGPWQEWIEPLDEAAEVEPLALSLLARYSGGVSVVRDGSAIVSFAGIRPQSPHVAEIGVRTDATHLRGKGIGRAVVARATKVILASERLPLYRCRADNAAPARLSGALGYRLYADSLAYFARSR